MSLIKMYVESTGTTTVSAEIDVPADGFITGVSLEAYLSAMTLATGVAQEFFAEISFMATDTFESGHDSRGVLIMTHLSSCVLTSGGVDPSKTNYLTNVRIKVFAGERLYLHAKEGSAAQVGHAVGFVHIDDKAVGRAAVRRR